MSRRKARRVGLVRYWGYIGLVAIAAAWINPDPVILMALSAATTGYLLFQAPVWCGAVNRGETTMCRENASGLLMGCYRRQHKWQKLKMAFVPAAWRRLNRGLWANPTTGVATLAAFATVTSAGAAVAMALRA